MLTLAGIYFYLKGLSSENRETQKKCASHCFRLSSLETHLIETSEFDHGVLEILFTCCQHVSFYHPLLNRDL